MATFERSEQIKREILTRKNGVWDAYDQGRWAAAMGYAREDNPHRIPSMPSYFHTNINEWFAGWDHETRDWSLPVGIDPLEGLHHPREMRGLGNRP